MQQVLVLGGGASGLAAALAAARAGAWVTVLERNAKPGKKLLATGNGRCTGIAPERYFTSDPAGLKPLLAAVNAADPLGWFESLGLYTRTDEAGRVYPYSNQAADVLALLEHHLEKYNVRIRCGCTVRTLSQSRGGYAVQFVNADGQPESLRTDAVICAMGAAAGPQFGTDGFGTTFAAQCGGKLAPLYPCLTALQIAKPQKALAGIRAKATASLLDGKTLLAAETGEVQFTDYGLSGICIMQLSGLLAVGRNSPPWSWTSSPRWTKRPLPPCLRPARPALPGTARRNSGWALSTPSWAGPSGRRHGCRKRPSTPCPRRHGRRWPARPNTGGLRG